MNDCSPQRVCVWVSVCVAGKTRKPTLPRPSFSSNDAICTEPCGQMPRDVSWWLTGGLAEILPHMLLREAWGSSHHQHSLHPLRVFLKSSCILPGSGDYYLAMVAHLKSEWWESLVCPISPLQPIYSHSFEIRILKEWGGGRLHTGRLRSPESCSGKKVRNLDSPAATWGSRQEEQAADESNRDTRSQVGRSKRLTQASDHCMGIYSLQRTFSSHLNLRILVN